MSLEQEAAAHMLAKKRSFTEKLREYATFMDKYMDDNLYSSHEVDNAKRNLQASVLWAEEAADIHGIK